MNKKGTKALASATLMSLVLTTALATGNVKAAAGQVTRVGGVGRYETAAKVATANFTTSENVVLVSGEGYADSVSASVLAKKLNAPIVLTGSKTLDVNAKSAIETLKAKNVYIIGGTGSISQSIQDGLESDYTVTRLGGQDRYATNLAIANKLVDLGVSKDNIIAVAGTGFADALSVAPVAATDNEILLLTNNNADTMKNTAEFAKDSNVTVVGTTNVVSDSIYNQLKADKRIKGGADRFETNINVLKAFDSDLKADKLYVANATQANPDNLYADALVASAIAGKYSAPLVLVDKDGSTGTNNAIDYIGTKATKTTDLQVVGGTGVVSDATVKAINDKVNPPVTNLKVDSVSAINANQIKVVFNNTVDKASLDGAGNVTVSGNTLLGKVSDGLQSDNKTLILTLGTPQPNNTNATLSLADIKAKDTDDSLTYAASVNFYDETTPAIDSVTSTTSGTAANTVKVKFSEPVTVSLPASSAFQVDGDAISKAVASTDKTEYTLTVAPGNELSTSDSHTVTVVGATDSINSANILTKSFNVTTDAVAPTVSLSSKSDKTIVLTFSKKMLDDASTSAVKASGNVKVIDETGAPVSSTVTLDKDDTNTNVFDVALTGVSYATKSSHTYTVILSNNIQDSVGNALAAQTPAITLTKDTVKPVVTSASYGTEANSGKVKDVVFNISEELDGSAVDPTKIKVVDNNGNNVTATFFSITSVTPAAGDKKVTLPLQTVQSLSGTYTFYIPSNLVTDNSSQANSNDSSTVTVNFGTASSTFEIKQSSFANASFNTDKTQTLAVDFKQPVKGGDVAGSATDVSNYTLSGAALPSGTYIYLTGNVANIVIPKNAITADNTYATLNVKNVQNTNGQVVNNYTGYATVYDNTAPVLKSAQVVDANTIILTFDSDINQSLASTNVAGEVTIKNGSDTAYTGTVVASKVVGNKKQVTLNLGSALDLTKTVTVETSNATSGLVDTSIKLNPASDVTVTATR